MTGNSRESTVNNEFRLDMNSMIRALLHDWWMILTAGFVGMVLAYMVANITYVPEYTTSMTFIVSSKDSTGTLSNLSAASSMAETFGEVLNSNLLKKRVKEELNLSQMPGDIETSVVEGTNLMTLSVKASSADLSFKIMKSVLNNYSAITEHVLDNVVLNVLQNPRIPKSVSNPLSTRDMMKKSALVGMALMTGLLVLLEYFRDTVKNEQEVEEKLDTKLLVTIYHEKKYKTLRAKISRKKKGLLITDPMNSFLFVENYKKLRTKLMYKTGSGPDKKKVILVTSVMENEGKSTVAVNLALTLAQKSDRVLLIEGDMRRPAVYKILQKKIEVQQEIGEYINGKISLKTMLQKDEESGLMLMLGSRSYSNSTEMVSGEAMKKLIETARDIADYIIIDSPPSSFMADAEIMAEYADISILVVRQGMADAKAINDIIDILENGHSELMGCVYNDVKTGIFSGRKSWGDFRYGGYYKYGHYYGYGNTVYEKNSYEPRDSKGSKSSNYE